MVLLAAVYTIGTAIASPVADVSPKDAFEKMKTLVGSWEGTAMGMDSKVNYKLTGSGSALMETIDPGGPYEMISMYHMDKNSLIMTHYCGAGNQPTLKFKPGKSADLFAFDFVHGANMDIKDMHMHSLKVKFNGKDSIESTWTSWSGGKPGEAAVFKMKRVKS